MSRPEAKPHERVFDEPWQAQAFALVVALHERGLFGWDEWAAVLSRHVGASQAAPDGSDYYRHWLAALEEMLATRGVAAPQEVSDLAEAWQRAAHATPHGRPILLCNDTGAG